MILGLGRSPGEGKGCPLQYSGLENSMDCRVHGLQNVGHDFHFHFFDTEVGFLILSCMSCLCSFNINPLSTILFANILFHAVKVKSLSRVRVFVTAWTIAYQVPPSMEFSRQEYWSGLPFPSSRGSSQLRDQTQVSCIAGRFFTI